MLIGAGIGIPFQQNVLARLLGSAEFFAPLTHSAIPTRAASGTTATFTRATTKTIENNDGYLVTLLAGEIGFVGARRVDNLIRLGAAQSSTLAIAANVTMTLPAGAYQFSMGAGTGTATFSGTGGATGTLAASASGRVFVAKTITAGTLIVTGSAAILNDIQVVSMVAETDQTTIREYVSVGVESAPYYHGSFVDGVKCFPTDLAGNALPTSYTYDAVTLNGVAGTYVSTPDSVAASITGDIDIRVKAALADWTPSAATTLVGKLLTTGNQRSYVFDVQTGGQLHFYGSLDGTALLDYVATSPTGFTDGTANWCRVTRSATTGTITFYTSSDGVTWTQSGAAVAGTSGSLFNSTALLELGTYQTGTAAPLSGKIYQAQIYNGIDGTLAVDFDASRYAGGTTLTGSTGETWTLQGNAIIHPTNNPMLGYSVEGARTNLCLQSEDFTTTWAAGAATVNANQSTAPNGKLTMDGFAPSAGVGSHFIYQDIAKASSALTYTYSLWVKRNPGQIDNIVLSASDGVAAGWACVFDPDTGDVLSNFQTVGAGFTFVDAQLVESENGAYRFALTITTTATPTIEVVVWSTNTTNSIASYAGNGVDQFYMWGAQVELGSFASSYIATTTIAVARNADVLTYSSAGNVSTTSGAMYMETVVAINQVAPQLIVHDALANNYFSMDDGMSAAGALRTLVSSGGAITANFNTGSSSANTVVKRAMSWEVNSVDGCINGTLGVRDTSCAMPLSITTISVGGAGTPVGASTFRNIRAFGRKLSPSELQAVTS